MVTIDIDEAQLHFELYVDAVDKGEIVILCRGGRPVAEMRRIAAIEEGRPRFGTYEGFGVGESFLEELPDDVLRSFEEVGENDPLKD